MSVEAFAIALHHSCAEGTVLHVLYGIANHDGDGGSWPAIATLAKYARTSERTVQRALRVLQTLGEIEIVEQAGGTHLTPDQYRPNLYRFLLECPPECDRTKNHRLRPVTPPPVDNPPDRGDTSVTPESDRGDTGGAPGVTPMSPEPSLEPPTAGLVSQPQTARDPKAVDNSRSTPPRPSGPWPSPPPTPPTPMPPTIQERRAADRATFGARRARPETVESAAAAARAALHSHPRLRPPDPPGRPARPDPDPDHKPERQEEGAA